MLSHFEKASGILLYFLFLDCDKMKIRKIIAIICVVIATNILTAPKIVRAANEPPEIEGQIPINGSTNIALKPTCLISITDWDDDELTVSFYENTTGNFVLVKRDVTPYSLVVFDYENATEYNTKYWWKVTVSDGTNTTSAIYHFTTTTEGGSPNAPPVANFTYEVEGLVITVNSTSTDPDGTITSWNWLFGDTYELNGPYVENTQHTYSAEGTYTVTLIVIDNNNATDYIIKEITIGDGNEDKGGGWVIEEIPTWTWYIGIIIVIILFVVAFMSKKKR